MSDPIQSFYNENGAVEETQKKRKKRNKKKKKKGPGFAEASEGAEDINISAPEGGKEMDLNLNQGFSVGVEGGESNHADSEFSSQVGQQVHFTIQGGLTPTVTKAEINGEHDINDNDENETLVIDVDEGNADHLGNICTTEHKYEAAANIDVDDLPEDIRERLLSGEEVKTTTMKIDGEEQELPEGMTVETFGIGSAPEDIAHLLPSTEGGGNVRVLEYTETILCTGDEDEEGFDEEIIQTVIIRKGPDGEDIEEIVEVSKDGQFIKRDDEGAVIIESETPSVTVDTNVLVIETEESSPVTVDTNVVLIETQESCPVDTNVVLIETQESSPVTVDTDVVVIETQESSPVTVNTDVVVIETQESSPSTFESNFEETFSTSTETTTHIKRVRTTKITKTRRVVITTNADGEEIETVVEGDDDDEDFEIDGGLDNVERNVEVHTIIKKRRIIITRLADGTEVETEVDDDEIGDGIDGVDTNVEVHTIVKKRRIIITVLPDGTEVETEVDDDDEGDNVPEDKVVLEVDRKFKVEPEVHDDRPESNLVNGYHVESEEVVTVETESRVESAVEFPDESKPHPGDLVTVQIGGFMPTVDFSGGHTDVSEESVVITEVEEKLPSEPFVNIEMEQSEPETVTTTVTEEHYIIHQDDKDDSELTAHLHDITHEEEDKVELEVNILVKGGEHDDEDFHEIDEDIGAPVENPTVESEVDFDFDATVTSPCVEVDEEEYSYRTEKETMYIIEADVKEVLIIQQPKVEVEKPKTEDVMTVLFKRTDIKHEHVANGDMNGDVSSRVGESVNLHFKFNTNEPTPERGPEFTTVITEEQRRILDSVTMEAEKSLLDEWVLVKFTQKEIQIFVDLMRFRPGYFENSMEQNQCCNVM